MTYKLPNWSKQHIERRRNFDDLHSERIVLDRKLQKFNYENVEFNSTSYSDRCSRCSSRWPDEWSNCQRSRFKSSQAANSTKCHSPVNFVNKNIKNLNRTVRSLRRASRMHSSPRHADRSPNRSTVRRSLASSRQRIQLAAGLLLTLICLIEHCDSKLLPISRPSIYSRPSSYERQFAEPINPEPVNLEPGNQEPFVQFTSPISSPDFRKELFFKTIQSTSNSLSAKKRSNSNVNNDEILYPADKKATNDDLFSSEAIEMPTNQMTLSNFLDSSLVVYKVNNLSDFDLANQTSDQTSGSRRDGRPEESDKESEDARQAELQQEEQERVLKEIDQINAGHICSSLNKQTHFKANKDSSAKNNRDKRYWLLVKALEPKFVKMPALSGQVQPSLEIKNYYRELVEKLELIASILYDNNAEQSSAVHNLALSRKVIREIAFLHPHILRARLISVAAEQTASRMRRHSSFSINANLGDLERGALLADDPQSNSLDAESNKLTSHNGRMGLNNVPFRRLIRKESSGAVRADELPLNDGLDAAGATDQAPASEQWLRAKNILFFMRNENEPVHEFNDVVLTTKKEHVSWLDVREVEERSGTVIEFDQLLTNGHLFVMNEKERLFAGYTGIYFDCATRRWLLSYTSLLVSCNQCSNKKQSASSASSDNELEMRLIGLLSVDIDLETVDVNQCDAPPESPSTKPDASFSPPLSKPTQSANNYQLNQLDSQQNFETNPNASQPTIGDPTDASSIDRQPTGQSNAPEQLYQLLHKRRLYLDAQEPVKEANLRLSLPLANSSLLTSLAQPLDSSSHSAFTSNNPPANHSSSPTDESYKLSGSNSRFTNRIMLYFEKTNKCHRESSQCEFVPNNGIRKAAGYVCKCKTGWYAVLHQFSGIDVERARENSQKQITQEKSTPYDRMYTCKKCPDGCETCVDSSPCLSSYNWAFRISLLTISILCICLIFVLTYYIYKYRKIKVFKVASPVFLSITLLGCAVMYAEMIMIFPVLNTGFCIMTKITRHMGFCITYSALLLKTWRVSLTYRVKSAHKLKLTDRQLLQWLFPILLVMSIFLGTWVISDPPKEVYILDWNKLKFSICEYNWFDHSLAIGELFFLLWGIKVCYNVRNAESFFNEAKYISWSIYNIAAVNILMILIHIILLPSAGPDVKFFLGFVRTQLSTTTTIALIFGPKFYRLIKGEGDVWDSRNKIRRGINASFSLNGVVHEELTDLYQENEELKEQVHKLATQVELMRLRQMQVNNRHLKSKHNVSSAASSQAVNSSVGVSGASVMANVTGMVGLAGANTASSHFHSYSYNQLNPQVDGAGIGLVTNLVGGIVGSAGLIPTAFSATQPAATCQRISPAAELQSEKV